MAAGDARVVDDDVRLAAAADDGDGTGEQVALAVDVEDRVRREAVAAAAGAAAPRRVEESISTGEPRESSDTKVTSTGPTKE